MMDRHIAEIPHEELHVLGAIARAMGASEAAGDALHLQVLAGGRRWIVQTDAGQLVADINDASSNSADPRVFHLSERLGHFAGSFGEDAVSLSAADGHTVTAYTSGASAAIDLVPWSGPEFTPLQFAASASAVVPMRRFELMLSSARSVPSGVEDVTYPQPPMWMQFGDGSIGLHVDWSDFLPSKSTYRMRTLSHQGQGTVSIPHALIQSVLRLAPEERGDEAEHPFNVAIGTSPSEYGDREAIRLVAHGWRLILWVAQPVSERWAARVDEVFATQGIEVAESDGIEWAIAGNYEVRAKLHHGHPDVARVTAVLLRNAEESIELFRELGQLNAASHHIRYWLDDGVVRSAVDVQCTELQRLPDIVRQVAAAAAKYAPMLAVLSSSA